VNDPVIVCLTPNGKALGQRLVQALGGEVLLAQDGARQTLEQQFRAHRPLVCVMALGIVVRILGPLARDKATDPPVVVVDEAGQFAISVLGGHEGGANALAKKVADVLGAVPVITTASDCLGLPALDLIGRDWGWQIEHREKLTAVAAAAVRGDPIGVYQTAGRRDWCEPFGPWPTYFQWLKTWPPIGNWAGLLLITDTTLPTVYHCPVVIYRPPTLVLGTGCRRGVPDHEIEAMFQHICNSGGFAPLSLGLVATVSLKANEPGLQDFAANHHVPLVTYRPEELAQVGPLPSPSEKVRAKIGIAGVAEPAAMLAAGTRTLLMPKFRGERITMALARREA
jgi:cobalamin biosynthesis protein CbiG